MYTQTVMLGADVDLAVLPTHLADRLRHINARTIKIHQDHISFTGGIFGSGSRWDILVPFGFGDLTVDSNSHNLRYRLSLRQLIICATVMVGILAGFGCYASHSTEGLIIAPVGWLWLVGGNLAIGIPRFKNFVRTAIDTAPRLNT
jgi:hypothetical protein